MSEANAAVVRLPIKLVEKLVPGEAQRETASMVGRGSMVFLAGMAVAAASFFVERAVVRAVRKI